MSQFLMATHSVELINDAEPEEIVSINSKFRSGKRVRTDEDFDGVYRYLGSSANADLARISRARRVIFVEGKDGRLLRKLARRLGLEHLAEASSVPIVQLGGFSRWNRAQDAAWAFRSVLNLEVAIFCLFDRDFRCEGRIEAFTNEINSAGLTCKVLDRKEIENYLIDPPSILRAISRRLKVRNQQTLPPTLENLTQLLASIASMFKTRVVSQMAADYTSFAEDRGSKIDKSTLFSEVLINFDAQWEERKYMLVPGKEFLTQLNIRLQKEYFISLSETIIIDCLDKNALDNGFLSLLSDMDLFCALQE